MYRSGAPRPQNAFILFRTANHKEVKEKHPELKNNELSKVIGAMWKGLPDDEKSIWKERQKQAAREHEERNPGYKFNPQQPGEKKEQQRLKKQERELKKQLKQQLKQKNTQQQWTTPAPTPARQVSGYSMTPSSNRVDNVVILQSGSSRVTTPSSSPRVTGVIARHQQPTPMFLQRVQPEDPFQSMASYQPVPAQQAAQSIVQNMRSSSMLSTSQANMPQTQQHLSSYRDSCPVPVQAQSTTAASPAASQVSADFSPSSDHSTVPTEHGASSLLDFESFDEEFHQAMSNIDVDNYEFGNMSNANSGAPDFDPASIQVPNEMIDPSLDASNNEAPINDAADHESISNLSVTSEFVNIEMPNNDTFSDSGVISTDEASGNETPNDSSASRAQSFSSEFSFVRADMLRTDAATATAHSGVGSNESAIDDFELEEFINMDMLQDDNEHNVAPTSNNHDDAERALLNAFSDAGYINNNSHSGLRSFAAESSAPLPGGNREDIPAAAAAASTNDSSSQQVTGGVHTGFQALIDFNNGDDENFTGYADLLGPLEDLQD